MPKFHEYIKFNLNNNYVEKFAELENLVNCLTIKYLKLKKSSTNQINFIIQCLMQVL